MPRSPDNVPEDVTALLAGVSAGKKDAWDKLLSVVYREFHYLARKAMRKGRPGQTLQTTALVNEAYIRLVKSKEERWQNRAHFFRIASRAMRNILVDAFRRKKAVKRGNGKHPLSLDELNGIDEALTCRDNPFTNWEALDRALDKLGAQECHLRKCTIVELRFFVGLTHEETAEILGVSPVTVKRDWEFTRSWLYREMSEAESDERGTEQES